MAAFSMELNFTLTAEDIRLYYNDYAAYRKKSPSPRTQRRFWWLTLYYTALIGVPCGLTLIAGLLGGNVDAVLGTALISAIVWRPLLDAIWRAGNVNNIAKTPHFLGQHCVRILPEGLFDHTSYMEWTIFWPGIENIVMIGNNILFLSERGSVFPIPCRVFSSLEESQAFLEKSEALWKSSAWPPTPTPVNSQEPDPSL